MGPSGRCWEVNPNPLGYLRRIFAETPADDCSGKIETGAGGGLCWWFMLVHFGAKLVRECLINISTYFFWCNLFGKGGRGWRALVARGQRFAGHLHQVLPHMI